MKKADAAFSRCRYRVFVYPRPLEPPPCVVEGGIGSRYAGTEGVFAFNSSTNTCQCHVPAMNTSTATRATGELGDPVELKCQLFGAPAGGEQYGSRYTSVHPMALAHLVHYRVLNSRCRTLLPSEATLFLLPLYSMKRASGGADDRVECAEMLGTLRRWRSEFATPHGVPYMDRHDGYDHFVVASKSMWPMDSCRVLFGQSPSIGHALRIGMDGGPSIAWKIDATGKSKRLAFNYSDPADYLTVPSVGAAHGRMGLSVAESLSHERRITASIFTLACCHANWQQALELRHVLVKQCSMASAGMRFVRPRASRQLHPVCHNATCACAAVQRGAGASIPSHATMPGIRASALALYLNSTFCLMPAGDWPSRTPAIVDAMACGCIPVFFHSAQLELWPAHLGGWLRDASVFFDYRQVINGSVHVVDQLQAISPDRIQAMRRHLHANLHRIVYSHADDDSAMGRSENLEHAREDAWGITLQHMQQRLRVRLREYAVAHASR